MKPDQILMTNVSLPESFHDVALYSQILYLWKDASHLSLYHYRKPAINKLPIYLDPFPVQTVSRTSEALSNDFIKEITFNTAVRDFVLFNHVLYYLDDSGLSMIQPESAQPMSKRLVEGDFLSLSLSTKNRLALASKSGLFEYVLTTSYQLPDSNPLIQWDDTPTAAVLWEGYDLIQLDEEGQAVQRLDFLYQNKELSLSGRFRGNALCESVTYFNPSFDLSEKKEDVQAMLLFDYLPSEEVMAASPAHSYQPITLPFLPHPAFGSSILEDDTLYIEETEKGLSIFLGTEPYFYLPKKDYLSFRTYPKSRNYQNHLHVLGENQTNFLIFSQLR